MVKSQEACIMRHLKKYCALFITKVYEIFFILIFLINGSVSNEILDTDMSHYAHRKNTEDFKMQQF